MGGVLCFMLVFVVLLFVSSFSTTRLTKRRLVCLLSLDSGPALMLDILYEVCFFLIWTSKSEGNVI